MPISARWSLIVSRTPLQGFGTQLLPHNVWLDPAYWPFAMFDSPLALDVSAAVGLGVPRARLLRHGALLRRVSASEYHRRTMEHHPVRAIGIPVDRVSGFLDQPGDCRRLRG